MEAVNSCGRWPTATSTVAPGGQRAQQRRPPATSGPRSAPAGPRSAASRSAARDARSRADRAWHVERGSQAARTSLSKSGSVVGPAGGRAQRVLGERPRLGAVRPAGGSIQPSSAARLRVLQRALPGGPVPLSVVGHREQRRRAGCSARSASRSATGPAAARGAAPGTARRRGGTGWSGRAAGRSRRRRRWARAAAARRHSGHHVLAERLDGPAQERPRRQHDRRASSAAKSKRRSRLRGCGTTSTAAGPGGADHGGEGRVGLAGERRAARSTSGRSDDVHVPHGGDRAGRGRRPRPERLAYEEMALMPPAEP